MHDMALWVLASVVVLVVGANYPFWRRRRKAIKRLKNRTSSNMPRECRCIADLVGAPVNDVERIWCALALFYGIPAEKLRCGDGCSTELKGIMGHPDRDIAAYPFFGRCEEAKDVLRGVTTWKDLVIAVYRIEVLTGKRATCVKREGDHLVHEWLGS